MTPNQHNNTRQDQAISYSDNQSFLFSNVALHIPCEQWQADTLCVCVRERERFTDSSLWCPIKHNTLFLSFPRKPLWNHAAVRHAHLNILSSKFIDHFSLFLFFMSSPTHSIFPLLPSSVTQIFNLARSHQVVLLPSTVLYLKICFWLEKKKRKKLDIFPVLQLPVNLTDGMCVLRPPSPLFFCFRLKMSFLWQFVLLKAMEKSL